MVNRKTRIVATIGDFVRLLRKRKRDQSTVAHESGRPNSECLSGVPGDVCKRLARLRQGIEQAQTEVSGMAIDELDRVLQPLAVQLQVAECRLVGDFQFRVNWPSLSGLGDVDIAVARQIVAGELHRMSDRVAELTASKGTS